MVYRMGRLPHAIEIFSGNPFPPYGLIKINWDVSVNQKKKKEQIGLGMIVKDNNGACLGARSETKELVADPAMAEAMATPSAMHFYKEASFF